MRRRDDRRVASIRQTSPTEKQLQLGRLAADNKISSSGLQYQASLASFYLLMFFTGYHALKDN